MKHASTRPGILHSAGVGAACAAAALGATGARAQGIPSAEQSAPMIEFVKTLKAQTQPGFVIEPAALGSFAADNVYTAITPCRIIDTRIAGGKLQPNATRTFDADGASFTSQGGSSGGCGVPFGVASSVAMTIHVVNPSGAGAVYAWGLGTKPVGSVINYVNAQTVSNNAIVPIVPGTGADFSLNAQTTTDVAVDVVGYFAAPVATTLDCVNVASAATSVPYNAYTAVDATCPATYRVTGGGTFPVEGTLGRPGIWIDGSPSGSSVWRSWVDNQTGSTRSVITYAVCCRVPGR